MTTFSEEHVDSLGSLLHTCQGLSLLGTQKKIVVWKDEFEMTGKKGFITDQIYSVVNVEFLLTCMSLGGNHHQSQIGVGSWLIRASSQAAPWSGQALSQRIVALSSFLLQHLLL